MLTSTDTALRTSPTDAAQAAGVVNVDGQTLLHAWRVRNALATEAESGLFNVRIAAIAGKGPKALPDQIIRAVRLRSEARALFDAATRHFDPVFYGAVPHMA